MQINLPPWPPARIVSEAVLAFNLRHLDTPIDQETAPWNEIHDVILRFLRHDLCQYDDQLRDHGSYDPEFRDELASRIAREAGRRYSWLRKDIDPRPFQEEAGTVLAFDSVAHSLAYCQTLRQHIKSAMRDLRRAAMVSNRQEKLNHLAEALQRVDDKIAKEFRFLKTPTLAKDQGVYYIAEHPGQYAGKYFFGGRQYAPNHFVYLPITCPECGVRIVKTKRPVPFGQAKRLIAFSCGCYSVAADPPAAGYVLPAMTLEEWTDLIAPTPTKVLPSL